MKNVGVIGLGAMGMGVARNLLRAGFRTHGCDVRQTALDEFIGHGGIGHSTPAALARECSVVILLVVDSAQIDEVLFGESGAAPNLAPGSVVVSSSTVAPAFTARAGDRLAGLGLRLIDSPVTGGISGAMNGTLALLTSGPEEAYLQCEDVLKAFSSKIYKFGPEPGLGSKMKVLHQLLVCCHMAVSAEAMALGLRENVDPNVLYDVVTHGAGNSWIFQERIPRVLAGDYKARTALEVPLKDISLVMETAKSSNFPLPMTSAAYEMFARASAAGLGKEDDVALIKTFPGIRLPGQS